MQQYPLLYSLQHCPYAIRARMGILLSKQAVYIRAINLKDKPKEMLDVSPSGTVPLLVMEQSLVIDESLEIMLWALAINDPEDLLLSDDPTALPSMLNTINTYDKDFKACLEKYKSAKRYHDTNKVYLRKECELFISELEQRLTLTDFFMGEKASLIDYAILPFIRQFARVERQWYLQSPYPNLRQWLDKYLQSPLFSKTMKNYPLWLESHESFLMGKN
ncbi:MAG: glutathione S-transferase [Gammaproteobacteria bacterium]|nr:MAG: glutathione S-transferase [Gammaproteobacteria bacterium]